MAKFWPFPAPTWSKTVITKTKIGQNLISQPPLKYKFCSKVHSLEVLDGLLLLAVALKATLGFHPILVFWGPLTSPNTWKVVSFLGEFLPFSFMI